LIAGALVVGLASQGTIRRELESQYNAFIHLGEQPSPSVASSGVASSRLLSGAGNRYDYWRVALEAFRERPLAGVGAGNYDHPYFKLRRTSEDVRQPHSLELQVLSELGLVGAGLLALFMFGVGWGVWRTARRATASPTAHGLAVAATGMVGAWLVHTSVDWVHLLPGVTAMALVAVVTLVRVTGAPAQRSGSGVGRMRSRVAVAAVVAVAITVAGVSLSRQGMADRYRVKAERALRADPAEALRQADRSLRLDREGLEAYYVKAAALARFNQPEAARATLLAAARREPGDFITWALLGDTAVRAGDLSAARRYYGRALRLNPLDPVLRVLAQDPGRASASDR
jgi:tetratricopeptide (TPR) repeat protein